MSASRPNPSERPLILCVDDDATALFVRKLVLERHGFDVLTAHDAETAIALFRTQNIRLVITDHVLPGRSGAELVLELKAINKVVPVVIFSGFPDAPLGTESADAYITKGMPVEDFISAVTSLLRAEHGAV